MQRDSAEMLALKALGWLAGNDELLAVFLGATGASAADLGARAGTPEMQVSVLEFLTMDDAWVMAFCDAEGVSYDAPMRALAALPGGGQVHWT